MYFLYIGTCYIVWHKSVQKLLSELLRQENSEVIGTEGKWDVFQSQTGQLIVVCKICYITKNMIIKHTEFLPLPVKPLGGQHLPVL